MEELKLVMESIQTLGGEAKTAFIVWILIRYALYYLLFFGFLAGLIFTIYKVLMPISQFGLISQIKGIMDFQGELTPREKREIIAAVKKGISDNRPR